MSPGNAVGEPAYRQVAETLKHRILSGEVAPGQRLPVEPELAEQFGVSRSTIREALRSLASQNLVHTTRGVTGGTFVVEPQADLVSQSLATGLSFLASAGLSVSTLLEVRELLEVPAARLAAIRRTDEQLERIHAALPVHGGSDPVYTPPFPANRRFHALILDAANNTLLEVISRPVFELLQERFLREQAPPAFWERVDEEHRRIVAAIADGDADRAATQMADHLKHLRTTYEQIDRQRGDAGGERAEPPSRPA